MNIYCLLAWDERKKTRTHKDLLFSVLEAHVTIFENKYWLKVEMCEILNLSLDVSNSTSDITNPRHLVRIHKESECVWGGGGWSLSQFLCLMLMQSCVRLTSKQMLTSRFLLAQNLRMMIKSIIISWILIKMWKRELNSAGFNIK